MLVLGSNEGRNIKKKKREKIKIKKKNINKKRRKCAGITKPAAPSSREPDCGVYIPQVIIRAELRLLRRRRNRWFSPPPSFSLPLSSFTLIP